MDSVFNKEELIKLKSFMDQESESQDDVWASDPLEFDKHWNDDVVKRCVIIWPTENDGNGYEIKVEWRFMDEDDYGLEDETIETFEVSLGDAKDDIDTFEDAINSFIKNGGKRSDLELLLTL